MLVGGLSLIGTVPRDTSEHVNPANPILRVRETAAPEPPGSEDAAAARALIARAEEIFATFNPSAPRGFLAQLYARAVAEDLVTYGADDLARLAADVSTDAALDAVREACQVYEAQFVPRTVGEKVSTHSRTGAPEWTYTVP